MINNWWVFPVPGSPHFVDRADHAELLVPPRTPRDAGRVRDAGWENPWRSQGKFQAIHVCIYTKIIYVYIYIRIYVQCKNIFIYIKNYIDDSYSFKCVDMYIYICVCVLHERIK